MSQETIEIIVILFCVLIFMTGMALIPAIVARLLKGGRR
jgi:hypothetical protein